MDTLIDAISPSAAPAPAPAPAASAPAPAPEPAVTPPQPPAAGNVNPYLPPATPPQNLQTSEPPAPADPSQPPQAPAQQGEQPQAPQIPAEYTQAYEWRAQIEREAQAFGGLDAVPAALKWGRMLFGLDQTPEGVQPAVHFLNELYRVDRQVYGQVLGAAANEHAERLLEHLENRFFERHEIPKDRLHEVKDFLRYGWTSPSETAHREFVTLLDPRTREIFSKLKPVQQNFYVNQVDSGNMDLEFAKQEIAEKGMVLAIDSERAQAREREAEAAKFEAEHRAETLTNQTIRRWRDVFVDAYAKKHNVQPADVLEKVAWVGGLLDAQASNDPRHPAGVAYRALVEAAKSGNELRMNAAMSQLRIAFEAEFDAYMAGRSGKAPVAPLAPQPPANSAQPAGLRQPQFEPDKPGGGQDWSKVTLDDVLFGRQPAGA